MILEEKRAIFPPTNRIVCWRFAPGRYGIVRNRGNQNRIALRPSPTQRDRHLRRIADNGKMGWQKLLGYNRCSRVEAALGRYKQVIGDGLRSCEDGRQSAEVGVAVHVLNQMLELGRPIFVRIA
jgi:hypothetical protein